MATPEQVAELRGELTSLRAQVEAVSAFEQGARAQLEEEVRACKTHIRAMGEKMEEDNGAVQFQMAEMKEKVTADRVLVLEATAAIAAASPTPQTSAVTVGAKEQLHLTQRKGFEGLHSYGGNSQWQEWRFTTVDWLKQENSEFASLLKKI